ncbi:MAG: HDOD domain-containing protein [Pseudomonadota bacterium]
MSKKARTSFNRLKSRMKDLPSIPSSLARIIKILDDPGSSARDLGRAIGRDQAVTAKILRIVNSAYYGFPRRIDALDHAVAVLGYRSIREIVLVTTLLDEASNSRNIPTLDRKQLWEHAAACGGAARTIAQKTGALKADSVFLAGLLHDIGKVFLDAFLGSEYEVVVKTAREQGILLIEAEEKILGANHTDFGHWLSEEWNLPPNLSQAVLYHHQPHLASDHYILACLVHLGDIMARTLEYGHGGDDAMPEVNRQAWASLNLTPRLWAEITKEFGEQHSPLGALF